MQRMRRALVLGALLFILVACSQQTTSAPAITPSDLGSPLASPTDDAAVSPLPTPVSATPSPTLLPRDHTPQPDLGIVYGMLSMQGQPAVGQVLYLASIIHTEAELEVAALDPVQDPRAESDASGYFAFLDVQPGRYALGIGSPGGPVLIRGEDGDEIIAEVQAGQSTDLGTIKIVPFGQ
jgi:hypothetical protein